MGGPKYVGQIINVEASNGLNYARDSMVNFVVPDRRMLQDETKFVDAQNPGILNKMIDAVSKRDPDQLSTYKICVDGTKINPSSKGEINLWEYEDFPTNKERRDRSNNELDFLRSVKEKIDKLVSFGHEEIDTCDSSDADEILEACRKAVTILSKRMRDMRQLKVKKNKYSYARCWNNIKVIGKMVNMQ